MKKLNQKASEKVQINELILTCGKKLDLFYLDSFYFILLKILSKLNHGEVHKSKSNTIVKLE